MMAKFGKKNENFEVEIKMKGKDGLIENFDEDKEEEAKLPDGDQDKPVVIEAENTLDMIQAALGGGKAPAKKKKATKKATVKKKVDEVDTTTRFFNNYGENPHLQQIENGYLQFLSAQHAKESHLKAVKKFQIMYALKKI